MNIFTNVQSFLHQLKDRLLENEKIRKLLYYTSPDALRLEGVEKEDAAKFITLTPIIEDEDGIAESYRNVFVAIYLGDFIPEDVRNNVSFKIAAYTTMEHYELENQKLRILELMGEIHKEISNVKFEFAGKVYPIAFVSENLIRGNFSGIVSTWLAVDSNEII